MQNNEQIKTKKVLIKVIIALVASILSLAISITASMAWVSKNLVTKDKGFGIALAPDLVDAFASSNKFIIVGDADELSSSPKNRFLPGSSEDIYIGMYNKSSTNILIDGLALEIPTIWINGTSPEAYEKNQTGYTTEDDEKKYDEMPVKVGSNYYYFGQNIKINLVSYTKYNAELQGEGTNQQVVLETPFLVEMTFNLDPVYLLPEDITNVSRISLMQKSDIGGESITLEQGKAVVFKFHIEFINSATVDQSMFMGFGTTEIGGYCHRSIYVDFKQEIN